jgi:hypothetical protein
MPTLEHQDAAVTDAAEARLRPMPDVIEAMRAELARLAADADRLQTVMSGAIVAASLIDPECLRESQLLDLLVQRLHGLSDFAAALGPTTSRLWLADPELAARSVRLADQAAVLAMPSSGPRPAAPDVSGDLELFG